MKVDSKKGQAALEFLMTYGWAILILAVVVSLLWQAGVFNPTTQIREGDTGFWGVTPYDTKYEADGEFTIILKNNIETKIEILNITVSTSNKQSDSKTWSPPVEIAAGNTSTAYTFSGLQKHQAGSNYQVFVEIKYNDTRVDYPSATPLYSSGRIWGSVE